MGELYIEYSYWLILGVLLSFWYIYRFLFKQDFGHKNSVIISIESKTHSSKVRDTFQHVLILLCICLFAVLLASPKKSFGTDEKSRTGIDIVLVLDLSVSMLATDFEPNRFEVAQDMLIDVIDTLGEDRVGLVVFSGKPFVSLPLTFDYSFVKETIQDLSLTSIDQSIRKFQGTAIGDALLSAMSVLEKGRKEEVKRSQAIILLTDGEWTITTLDPVLVAKKAKEEGVHIYTIGLGGPEGVILDVPQLFGSKQEIVALDEETLQTIANITDASYHGAKDSKSLQRVLDEVSGLVRSSIIQETNTSGLPYWKPFLYALIVCILALTAIQSIWKIDE